MSFTTPDYQAIRDAILRDIANQEPSANVASDGDFALRANATGAAIEGLYQHQEWIARQIFPDTADADLMERHASLRGLTRKAARAATGSMTFSGTPASAVPAGTEAKTAAGVAFVTTGAGVIGGGGTVSLAAQAVVVGMAGNQPALVSLSLTAAPAGVLSTASVVTMTGGTDTETDGALLARLLYIMRNPPQGGAAHDYVIWAKDVPGVGEVYAYPLRRGLGTIDVLITTAGGLPDAQLLADVQDYVAARAPVGADFVALAPVLVPVAVTSTVVLAAGATLPAVSLAISDALTAYFATLTPGATVYLSRLRALISGVSGVLDFNLTAPAANVASTVDTTHIELLSLGVVTLT